MLELLSRPLKILISNGYPVKRPFFETKDRNELLEIYQKHYPSSSQENLIEKARQDWVNLIKAEVGQIKALDALPANIVTVDGIEVQALWSCTWHPLLCTMQPKREISRFYS